MKKPEEKQGKYINVENREEWNWCGGKKLPAFSFSQMQYSNVFSNTQFKTSFCWKFLNTLNILQEEKEKEEKKNQLLKKKSEIMKVKVLQKLRR